MNERGGRVKVVNNLKIAELSSEYLEAIKELEKRLGDICLIAAEKIREVFVLEAKLGPNIWEPVDKVYPEIKGLKAVFFDEEDAKTSKAALKSLLNSREQFKHKKRPIRIRKIT